MAANTGAVVFKDTTGPKVAFITYYKSEYRLHIRDAGTEAMKEVDQDVRAAAEGTLHSVKLAWEAPSALCVVVAAGGYPGDYAKGDVIEGLAEAAKIATATTISSEPDTSAECVRRVPAAWSVGDHLIQ